MGINQIPKSPHKFHISFDLIFKLVVLIACAKYLGILNLFK